MPGLFSNIDTLVWGKHADAVYGTKPVIPQAPTSTQIATGAVAASQAALPGAQKLAVDVNTFNQSQLQQLMEKAFPGASAKIQANISDMLAGNLPSDVTSAVQRSGAERAVAGGFQDTGFGRNLVARDLGLTSLQLTQQGISSAEKWLSVATAPQFDVSSMFISPREQYQISSDQFNRDLLAAKVAAAPDPAARGSFDSFMGLIGMVASAYGGGPGYTQTYKPDYTDRAGGGGFGGGYSGDNFYIDRASGGSADQPAQYFGDSSGSGIA